MSVPAFTSVILERLTRVALLGMRFGDVVSQTIIAEGLRVIAYPELEPESQVQASVNASGVYYFLRLPGLREYEMGASDDAFWQKFPLPKNFIVEVHDDGNRFVPFQFVVRHLVRGLFQPDGIPAASPLNAPPNAIPLYSSPARSVSGGMAVVRAQVWDLNRNTPAAFAMLEVQVGDQVAAGVADEQGRVLVVMPYPAPPPFSMSSPLSSSRRALSDQTWQAQLRAYYAPPSPLASPSDLPDLSEVLNQSQVDLLASLSPATILTQAQLEFGKTLILKTHSNSALYLSS